MPDRTHVTEEELILHYYGEPEADPRVDGHLAVCAACRTALAQLGDTLSLVELHRAPEPLAGLEERVWARVQADITARRSHWFARLFDGTPRWATAGAVATIVIAAFVAGRVSRPSVDPAAPPVAATAADTTERVLLIAIGDHLDQSQMVLLELLHADTTRMADIANERERARDLVAANRLYRQTAVRSGEEGVGDVLDALERVLLEIANSPSKVSARDLESLRAYIEERGILFRVRVVASEMRAREQQEVMVLPEAGP